MYSKGAGREKAEIKANILARCWGVGLKMWLGTCLQAWSGQQIVGLPASIVFAKLERRATRRKMHPSKKRPSVASTIAVSAYLYCAVWYDNCLDLRLGQEVMKQIKADMTRNTEDLSTLHVNKKRSEEERYISTIKTSPFPLASQAWADPLSNLYHNVDLSNTIFTQQRESRHIECFLTYTASMNIAHTDRHTICMRASPASTMWTRRCCRVWGWSGNKIYRRPEWLRCKISALQHDMHRRTPGRPAVWSQASILRDQISTWNCTIALCHASIPRRTSEQALVNILSSSATVLGLAGANVCLFIRVVDWDWRMYTQSLVKALEVCLWAQCSDGIGWVTPNQHSRLQWTANLKWWNTGMHSRNMRRKYHWLHTTGLKWFIWLLGLGYTPNASVETHVGCKDSSWPFLCIIFST